MLPKIGLGGIVEGNNSTQWIKKDDFIRMLDVCTSELGITYIDSAQIYRLSEEVIGGWLKKKEKSFRDSITLGTKVYFEFQKDPAPPYSHQYILDTFQQSLQKLNTDYVDLYWLHGPHPIENDWKMICKVFHEICQSGQAKEWGVSNIYRVDDLKNIINICDANNWIQPAYLQNEYHLIYHYASKTLIEEASKLNLKYVAFSPLASGTLSGKYQYNNTDPSQSVPEGSRWHTWLYRFPPQYCDLLPKN